MESMWIVGVTKILELSVADLAAKKKERQKEKKIKKKLTSSDP